MGFEVIDTWQDGPVKWATLSYAGEVVRIAALPGDDLCQIAEGYARERSS